MITAVVRVLLTLCVGFAAAACGWTAALGHNGLAIPLGLLFLALLWIRDGFERRLRVEATS